MQVNIFFRDVIVRKPMLLQKREGLRHWSESGGIDLSEPGIRRIHEQGKRASAMRCHICEEAVGNATQREGRSQARPSGRVDSAGRRNGEDAHIRAPQAARTRKAVDDCGVVRRQYRLRDGQHSEDRALIRRAEQLCCDPMCGGRLCAPCTGEIDCICAIAVAERGKSVRRAGRGDRGW